MPVSTPEEKAPECEKHGRRRDHGQPPDREQNSAGPVDKDGQNHLFECVLENGLVHLGACRARGQPTAIYVLGMKKPMPRQCADCDH